VDEYYLPGSVFVKTTPCDFNSWIAYIADEDGALGMQRGGEVYFYEYDMVELIDPRVQRSWNKKNL
jgi:hypothetical protein